MPEESASPGRSWRGAGQRDTLLVLATLLVLGVVAGALWWLLVDPAQFTKTARGGAMSENELAKQFNADAWFAVLGLAGGLLAGLVLAGWRRRDPLLTSGLVLTGSLLAAAVTWGVGHLLGSSDTEAALRAAAVGDRVPQSLGVDTWLAWLGWPVGALTGTFAVLVGRSPGHPEPPEHAAGAGRSDDGWSGLSDSGARSGAGL